LAKIGSVFSEITIKSTIAKIKKSNIGKHNYSAFDSHARLTNFKGIEKAQGWLVADVFVCQHDNF